MTREKSSRRAERFLRRWPNRKFPSTVRCGNNSESWKTTPMCRFSGGSEIPRAVSSNTRSPKRINPSCERRNPAIMLRTLDLPLPEGPKIAVNRSWTSNATSKRNPLG